MANRGYDVVVDVDQEVRSTPIAFPLCVNRQTRHQLLTIYPQGDLGHTDLQEDLEFHSSSTPHTPLLHLP